MISICGKLGYNCNENIRNGDNNVCNKDSCSNFDEICSQRGIDKNGNLQSISGEIKFSKNKGDSETLFHFKDGKYYKVHEILGVDKKITISLEVEDKNYSNLEDELNKHKIPYGKPPKFDFFSFKIDGNKIDISHNVNLKQFTFFEKNKNEPFCFILYSEETSMSKLTQYFKNMIDMKDSEIMNSSIDFKDNY